MENLEKVLIGMKVISFRGKSLGKVVECHRNEFVVEDYFWRFGSLKRLKHRQFQFQEIAKIVDGEVHLHPSNVEYWQYPKEVMPRRLPLSLRAI